MCFRDEIPTNRSCITCGAPYYGSLGHIGCPGPRKVATPEAPKEPEPEPFVCAGCKGRSYARHRCKSPVGGLTEKQRKQRRVTEKLPICTCNCVVF